MTNTNSKVQYIAKNTIPCVSVLFQGVLQNTAPEPDPHAPKHLTIRLNGRVQAVLPLPTNTTLNGDEDHASTYDNTNDDDEADLLKQVDKAFDENDQDSEDGPDWMFDKDETLSPDPNYVFCPTPHCKQILHLFTKHFCQHPIFPEHHASLTAD